MKEKDRKAWETILLGKKEAQRLDRVRKRKKYRYWQVVWEKVKKVTKPEEVMWLIWEAINDHHGYVYLTQAGYAEEALNLFLKDIGVTDGGEEE